MISSCSKLSPFVGRCHIRKSLAFSGLSKSEVHHFIGENETFFHNGMFSYFLAFRILQLDFVVKLWESNPVLLRQVVSKGRTLPGFVHCPKQAAEPGPSGL